MPDPHHRNDGTVHELLPMLAGERAGEVPGDAESSRAARPDRRRVHQQFPLRPGRRCCRPSSTGARRERRQDRPVAPYQRGLPKKTRARGGPSRVAATRNVPRRTGVKGSPLAIRGLGAFARRSPAPSGPVRVSRKPTGIPGCLRPSPDCPLSDTCLDDSLPSGRGAVGPDDRRDRRTA
jgi:hypothetical protein